MDLHNILNRIQRLQKSMYCNNFIVETFCTVKKFVYIIDHRSKMLFYFVY